MHFKLSQKFTSNVLCMAAAHLFGYSQLNCILKIQLPSPEWAIRKQMKGETEGKWSVATVGQIRKVFLHLACDEWPNIRNESILNLIYSLNRNGFFVCVDSIPIAENSHAGDWWSRNKFKSQMKYRVYNVQTKLKAYWRWFTMEHEKVKLITTNGLDADRSKLIIFALHRTTLLRFSLKMFENVLKECFLSTSHSLRKDHSVLCIRRQKRLATGNLWFFIVYDLEL